MSEHKIALAWKRTSPDFAYETYNREHTWTFKNGSVVNASAAPAYRGKTDCVDPEETLVASISSCHMLTFLALACRKKLIVDSYVDDAVGHLEKNADGKLAVTRVELRPQIKFGGSAPSAEELAKLHDHAHHECFIANSVRTEVSVTSE